MALSSFGPQSLAGQDRELKVEDDPGKRISTILHDSAILGRSANTV
jgi:hypothetical protein